MNEQQEKQSHQKENTSVSTYTLLKFVFNLVKNQPKKALTLATKKLTGAPDLEALIGQEAIQVLNHLRPKLHDVVDVLLSSSDGTNVDELYEAIRPKFDTLLNHTIGSYGVSLKEIGIEEVLTESYIKSELLPIFLIVRDIPKFCKSIKEKNFLKIITDSRAQLMTHLETDLHAEIRKYLIIGTDDLYEVNPQEPALVSQIKKLLNALAYAEKIVTFINSMDLSPDSGFKLADLLAKKGDKEVEFMTKVIWTLAMKDSIIGNLMNFELDFEEDELQFIKKMEQTLQYAREAQASLLEIDLPIYQLFGEELGTIAGVINSLERLTKESSKTIEAYSLGDTATLAKKLGEEVGKPTGVLIDQLKPQLGKTDYSFLTQHLGLLPGYLDKLTQLIYIHGAGKPNTELAVSEIQTEAFKDSAIKLFFEISNYEQHMVLQKGAALVFPIRKELTTLGQGAFQQVTRVSEATGEMVAHQLFKIKTEVFTTLICESDKLELYFGLEPGVLTKPLLLKINEIYQTLIEYGNLVVDLKEKYPDLLQFDNTSLLAQRLQHTLQQQNTCLLRANDAKKAKQDLTLFDTIFDKSNPQERRDNLYHLYQSFKHYVIEYNPRLSVLIDQFIDKGTPSFSTQELKRMVKEVAQLCDKDINTFDCYATLAASRLREIPKQIKGKLFPLDSTNTRSFLIIDEMRWLVDNSGLTDTQPHTTNERPEFIDDLAALTREHRADLYSYHSIRTLTLNYIQQEIGLFLTEIANPESFSKKNINSMIERYRILQPYLVNALGTMSYSDTDKIFVELLNQLANHQQKPQHFVVILDAVKAGINKLNQQITTEIARSKSRQLLFEIPYQQVKASHTTLVDNAPLTLESELVKRQDKWIRHQSLSHTSEEMKKVFFKLLKQFDPSLKLTSVKEDSDEVVPFPEMENNLEALTVPTQVSWLKRMLNIVHYIHVNFKYLESLEKGAHTKAVPYYFLKGPLVEGIYQIKPFLELTKAYQTFMELMQEPAGQLFYDSLQNEYGKLLNAWDMLKPLYFIDAKEVSVKNKQPVETKGLWYPLVSLMVLPEHLTALSLGTNYSQTDAEKAQQQAKETTQYIEGIIKQVQAEQYFSLLMRSPYIVFKFWPDLKEKIRAFRSDTHGITVHHLRDIQATLHSLLRESDALELQLGIQAGLISNPTKLIIDQLFNGFIAPLGISLQESTQLILDTSSFKQRLELNNQNQIETKQMLASETRLYQDLDGFLKLLEEMNKKTTNKQAVSLEERETFKVHYWNIYPLLQSQQSHYSLFMNQRDKSIELDAFCDECLTAKLQEDAPLGHVYHYNSLTNVLHLTKSILAAKKGNINSLEMKGEYLKSQAKSIANAKQQYVKTESKEAVEASIRHHIDTQIERICKRASQSVYLMEEFRSTLLTRLLTKKEDLLQKLSTIPVKHLEKTITEELEKQFDVFTKTEYVQLAHLDAILTQVEHFQTYCQKEKLNPRYEDIDPISGTLLPKIELLNKLKTIVLDNQIPLEKRISLLQNEAKKDSFYTILMTHDNHTRFDLKTLKRVFLNLFHSIFNFFGASYRPADFYTSLDKAIKNEQAPSHKSLLQKAGFFSEDNTSKGTNKSAEPSVDSPEPTNKPQGFKRG